MDLSLPEMRFSRCARSGGARHGRLWSGGLRLRADDPPRCSTCSLRPETEVATAAKRKFKRNNCYVSQAYVELDFGNCLAYAAT